MARRVEVTLKLWKPQMTTRVGLDATCYSNPDDDTCRIGCNRENDAQAILAQMVARVQLDVSHVSRGVTIRREKRLRYIRNA